MARSTRQSGRNSPAESRRPPISDRQLEMVLAATIRKQDVFRLARTQLTSAAFQPHHGHYALLWAVLVDCWDRDGSLPDEETICGEVQRRVDRATSTITDEQLENLDAFLRVAFSLSADSIRERTVYRLLREYLEDRLISDLRQDLSATADVPDEPYLRLQRLTERASEIRSIQEVPQPDLFAPGWDTDGSIAVRKVETGVDWLDNFLDGGPGRGEVVGLLGPHGSCKTTIAMQTAVSVSTRANREWRDRGSAGRLGCSYVFIYEGSVAQMRLRALSCAASISRASLESGRPEELSTSRRLKPYERELFATALANNGLVRGERERRDSVLEDLNRNLRIFDMTGADPNAPGRGWGLCPEIAALIDSDLRNRRRSNIEPAVDCIFVDYVGAAARRYLEHHNLDFDGNLRHQVGGFPFNATNQLARRFDCPVFLNHQFSGSANSKDPTARLKGTDAAESKSFRENLDFLILAGAIEQSEQLVAVALDKRRRGPPRDEVVLRLRGELCRVEHAPNWLRNSDLGRFVPRSQAHSVGGGGRDDEAVARALRRARGGSSPADYSMEEV